MIQMPYAQASGAAHRVGAALIAFWTLFEGLVSLYRGGELHPSVLSVGVSLLRWRPAPVSPPRPREKTAETDQGDWISARMLRAAQIALQEKRAYRLQSPCNDPEMPKGHRIR
jgi:hypothetical protein